MARLVLPALVIGPGLGARRSQILAQSAPLADLPDGDQQRLLELPLILAGWMRAGESDLIACLPTTADPQGARVLLRAHTIGELNGEPLGYANALYLPREAIAALDGRTELLVSFLPAPSEDMGFAARAVEIDLAEIAPATGIPSGLEWQDHAVIVADDADRLPAVLSLLAGLGHAPQHRRVIGWASSMALPARDSFVPTDALQLVAGTAALPGWSGHRLVHWHAGRIAEPALPAPPGWQTREQLVAMALAHPLLAGAAPGMAWTFPMAAMSPPAVVGALLARIMGRDSGDGLTKDSALGLELLDQACAQGLIGKDGPSMALTLEHCGPWRAALLSALIARPAKSDAAHRAAHALADHAAWAGDLDDRAFARLIDSGAWLERAVIDFQACAAFSTVRLGALARACERVIAALARTLPERTVHRLHAALETCFIALLERADWPGLEDQAMAAIARSAFSAPNAPDLRPRHIFRLSQTAWRAAPDLAAVIVKKYINLRGNSDSLDDPEFRLLAAAAMTIVEQALEHDEHAVV